MASISPSTLQHYRVTFYTNNQTRQGTEYIEPIAAPDWFSYPPKDYRMVQGDYTNGQASTFEGNIVFLLTSSETKDIDPSTLIVIDKTTWAELILNSDYYFTGTAIEIFPSFVGSMHTGDTLSIRVLYLTDETSGVSTVSQDTVLGIPLYLMVFIVLAGFGLLAALLYLSKKPERRKLGKQIAPILVAIGVIATLIMLIYTLVGG
jgi:hypothetical protein